MVVTDTMFNLRKEIYIFKYSSIGKSEIHFVMVEKKLFSINLNLYYCKNNSKGSY
jgi:hypothetical protein